MSFLQTCIITPPSFRLGVRRSSFAFRIPRGRAERLDVSPRPRRHVRTHNVRAHGPVCFRHTVKTKASEAAQRPRSAREWTLRLAPCPRGVTYADVDPVRASCRPDMHLDRPPVLPASVPARAF